MSGLAYAPGMSKMQIATAAELVRFGASMMIDCGACGASRTLNGPDVVKCCGPGSSRARELRLKC